MRSVEESRKTYGDVGESGSTEQECLCLVKDIRADVSKTAHILSIAIQMQHLIEDHVIVLHESFRWTTRVTANA